MQSALRIGRFGPLTLYLNYIWLFATVLLLWWVALLWLPDNYPGWNGAFYWLAAVAVLILYVLSVIAHELVHTVVARGEPRSAMLYPFGAAVPFRFSQVEPARALLSALAAPIFNIALGGALIGLSGAVGGFGGVLAPLGWLNLGMGALNLLPGIPFDGGWALSATTSWFSGDRESGTRIATLLGLGISLLLVLAGAWVGLTTDNWLPALALVLSGWAAREAGSLGKQRGVVRDVLERLQVSSVMDTARPSDSVFIGETVAGMVKTHPRYPPNIPLPVMDEGNKLVGVITLAQADTLLQGTWAATPVRALTTQIGEVRALRPDSPLTEALEIANERRDTPEEDTAIPVLENGSFVGSVLPGRLEPFGQVGQEFGVEGTGASRPAGILRQVGAILPAVMVVAAMAVLGSLALRTNPAELKEIVSRGPVTFTKLMPQEDAIVGVENLQISAQIGGPSAITTGTMTLDGAPIEAQLSGTSPLTQTLTAQIPGLTQGIHTIGVTAGTEGGQRKSAQWQFRASARGEAEAVATPSAQPQPTSVTAREPLQVTSYAPSLGGRIVAGATDVPITLRVEGQPVQGAQVSLDGQELQATVEQMSADGAVYTVSASAPTVAAGIHRVRVSLEGEGGGSHTSEWTFTAIQPDDNNAYFMETGYFVSQPFLKYWQDNGGLAIFGYPISDRLQETAKPTNETYTAQYFERARFELHADTGDAVMLGRLGALIQPPEEAVAPKAGAQFFPTTGHNVGEPFFTYWNRNGGLAVFGFPITEERTEKNPIDGKEYTVQYFERNRFERHPEQAGTPFEVQLGQLGTQLYKQNYAP